MKNWTPSAEFLMFQCEVSLFSEICDTSTDRKERSKQTFSSIPRSHEIIAQCFCLILITWAVTDLIAVTRRKRVKWWRRKLGIFGSHMRSRKILVTCKVRVQCELSKLKKRKVGLWVLLTGLTQIKHLRFFFRHFAQILLSLCLNCRM